MQYHKNNYYIIFNYKKPGHWDLFGCLNRASWPRFFEICLHDSFWAAPVATLPRSVGKTALAFPYQLNLPTDALIDLKVRRRLGRFIPVWGWLNCFTVLRSTVIPQRWPGCRVMRGGFVSGPMCCLGYAEPDQGAQTGHPQQRRLGEPCGQGPLAGAANCGRALGPRPMPSGIKNGVQWKRKFIIVIFSSVRPKIHD